tara:strand:- start:228 stop:416 length:189 start_codon:yes stop_codon:yes gene_type:complete
MKNDLFKNGKLNKPRLHKLINEISGLMKTEEDEDQMRMNDARPEWGVSEKPLPPCDHKTKQK